MKRLSALSLVLTLAGCASVKPEAIRAAAPADVFLDQLRALCGQAFAGKVVSTDALDADMAKETLVMQVRECGEDTIRIPFHVGEDRSRTWVLTRTADGLRLKHDHRHADGTSDAVTMYGGDAGAGGSSVRQEFPADAASREMFLREGRAVAIENVWTMTIAPGRQFAYELHRPQRHFRVEFDLTRPVSAPPPPWGAE